MRAWINGDLLPDATAPAVLVSDHGLTVGDGVFEAIKVVDGLPFALDRHLERLHRSAAGLGLPAVDDDVVRRGVGAVLEGLDLPLARLRITLTGGPAPMGSGRGDASPTLIVVADAMQPWPETTAVATVDVAAQRARRARRPQDHVVRRERGRAHRSEGAGRERGDLREPGRPPVRGHRLERLLRRRRRAPHPHARQRLPGRASPAALLLEWYGGREVDEPIEVVVEQASEVFLASTTRDVQAVARWDDRELPAPGPVTAEAAACWREREPELLGL